MPASNSAIEPGTGCVAAVDIGTQTTRAALVSPGGRVLDVATTPVPPFSPATGWAEQRPADW
ncbi:hypothetical protein [Rhizomonospora bruguierae]|uniref:hypothetical protein n=1 Tax=Rhizomonospora bruguierae TaxID=1581705 RepID=UPI001BD11487|nr:hypothetical protein [Micromonospora sp. NBRC 107566]